MGRQCIPANNTCNRDTECMDGSDEAPKMCGCLSDQFTCVDGEQCVRKEFECDGDRDCSDGSDEEMCERDENGCVSSQFGCSDGSRCIRSRYKCDGITTARTAQMKMR